MKCYLCDEQIYKKDDGILIQDYFVEVAHKSCQENVETEARMENGN